GGRIKTSFISTTVGYQYRQDEQGLDKSRSKTLETIVLDLTRCPASLYKVNSSTTDYCRGKKNNAVIRYSTRFSLKLWHFKKWCLAALSPLPQDQSGPLISHKFRELRVRALLKK
ncbi:hypothetical protein BgiBS90_005369, partial [Biomphalaria glabrata]